jgi:malate dehydrogenase
MERSKLDAIVDRTRNGGAEIVKFLKTGLRRTTRPRRRGADGGGHRQGQEAHPSPAPRGCRASTGCATSFLGVPVKLGRNGMEGIIEVELTDEERAALQKSADAVLEPMALV